MMRKPGWVCWRRRREAMTLRTEKGKDLANQIPEAVAVMRSAADAGGVFGGAHADNAS